MTDGIGQAAGRATPAKAVEGVGEIILSTSLAAAYGVYLLVTGADADVEAYCLIVAGASSALLIYRHAKADRGGAAPSPFLLAVPFIFSLYLIGVIGLLAFGQAIVARDGFWAIATGLFWAFDGARLLWVLRKMRQRRGDT